MQQPLCEEGIGAAKLLRQLPLFDCAAEFIILLLQLVLGRLCSCGKCLPLLLERLSLLVELCLQRGRL